MVKLVNYETVKIDELCCDSKIEIVTVKICTVKQKIFFITIKYPKQYLFSRFVTILNTYIHIQCPLKEIWQRKSYKTSILTSISFQPRHIYM